MNAESSIRESIAAVTAIRVRLQAAPELAGLLQTVKHFQGRRFVGTYQDLLNSQEFGAPTQFFLDELYAARDFSERDNQFARIAGALETFFPATVVETATTLAQLHSLTEALDFSMANELQALGKSQGTPLGAADYLSAWRRVATLDMRMHQLNVVLQVGAELTRLTQTKGLRMSLRLMRGPAKAAGLSALQYFLENGFDTFASLGKNLAPKFMQEIQQRETYWISTLFDAPFEIAQSNLERCTNG